MTESGRRNVIRSEEARAARLQHVVINRTPGIRNSGVSDLRCNRLIETEERRWAIGDSGAGAPESEVGEPPASIGGAAAREHQPEHFWPESVVRSYDNSLCPFGLVLTSKQW